ncbi:hypothetical protein NKH77_43710 [Streptomyces sp. M19]
MLISPRTCSPAVRSRRSPRPPGRPGTRRGPSRRRTPGRPTTGPYRRRRSCADWRGRARRWTATTSGRCCAPRRAGP